MAARLPAAAVLRPALRAARATVLALLLVAGLTLGLACGDPEKPPPGLLLVTVDTLRADFLACYGGAPGVGQRICGLGDEGTRYVWAFATAPSSSPAVASILTSRYPTGHGVGPTAASFLPARHVTLAESLRDAGFATAAFVASPELNRSRNLQQGFDVYDDHTVRGAPGALPARPAADLTDAALAWLEETRSPWFLWVHYREPHGPYQATPGPDDEVRAVSAERLRVLATPSGRGGIPSYQALPGLFTRQGYEARYRAEIRRVDAEVGRLLDAVDARTESVGVLLTADHGEAFGEDRYYFSHGHSVGLEQIRVPLFWRPPEGHKPEVIRVAVSTLDVMPTLLRAAGLGRPDTLEGWVLPNPEDPPGAPEQARAIFAEHPDAIAVVSGTNFYTRLRRPMSPAGAAEGPGAKPEDPSPPTAAYLRAHDARTAQLGDGSALPRPEAARPTGITPLLEPRLREFLAAPAD